ncbi:hypothetical protein [Streptomyces sp. NPDC051704]|uniref:hypothetical protein n=1 Tax=Streptomyces sp. NPDC051704 TaxID=3365671 RepID=UPI00378D56CF
MGTMVVGFRLGSDAKGRQATLVLTEAGVLHQSTGPLGMAPRPSKPHAPIAPDHHPVPRQAAEMRRAYAALTGCGYTRALIPPACVRLDTDEHPLHAQPYGPHAPRPHPELIAEFTGAAPAGPGSLEAALAAFYAAIGITPRRRTPLPPGTGVVPSRAREALRTLTEGRTLTSGSGRDPAWTVTAAEVRLHTDTASRTLDPREVAELQAALTAWLGHRQRTGPAGRRVEPGREGAPAGGVSGVV